MERSEIRGFRSSCYPGFRYTASGLRWMELPGCLPLNSSGDVLADQLRGMRAPLLQGRDGLGRGRPHQALWGNVSDELTNFIVSMDLAYYPRRDLSAIE